MIFDGRSDLILGFIMFLLLMVLAINFLFFVYKILGGARKGMESFYFFDFLFFENEFLSNFSSFVFLVIYIVGCALEWERASMRYMLISGIAANLLFFIHCRCFSNIRMQINGKVMFIRELLRLRFNDLKFFFLWLSQVSYLVCLYFIIFN